MSQFSAAYGAGLPRSPRLMTGASGFEDSPPMRPARRVGLPKTRPAINPSQQGSSQSMSDQTGLTSTKSQKKKKNKLHAVSQASLATFHPAYAMGIDVEPSWAGSSVDSLSTSAMGSASSDTVASGSTFSSSSSAKPTWERQASADSFAAAEAWHTSPTPELEAFTVGDLQSALTRRPHPYIDFDEDEDLTDEAVWGDRSGGHRRGPTLASVFEDDGDADGSPKASHTRRVAFRIKNGSMDSTKSPSPLRHTKALPDTQASNLASASNGSGSPLARLFHWRKGGKNQSGSPRSGAAALPSSAPPHITTFDQAGPPCLEPDSGSESNGGSLPSTPMHATCSLPGTSPSDVMPHRRAGPPPRSILRKQSAPALRQGRPSQDAPATPLKSTKPLSSEAPVSLPHQQTAVQSLRYRTSPHTPSQGLPNSTRRRGPPSPLVALSSQESLQDQANGSGTGRRYSTVGRGVARNRNASLTSLSSVEGGSIKSPKGRKQHNKRFDNLPNSPSIQALYGSPPSSFSSGLQLDYPLASRPSQEDVFASPGPRSMTGRVVGGMLRNAHGFEEPAPRSANSVLHTESGNATLSPSNSADSAPGNGARAYRRRSRSVGALDFEQMPSYGSNATSEGNQFAAAFAGFMKTNNTSMSSSSASSLVSPSPSFRGTPHAQGLGLAAAESYSSIGSESRMPQASPVVGLGRGKARQEIPERPRRRPGGNHTPTQQSGETFQRAPAEPPRHDTQAMGNSSQPRVYQQNSPQTQQHRTNDSMESSSSESSDLHELADAAVVETVQARRVQLVNTRAKATAVSSPSMASLTRSPRPSATAPPASAAPMVNIFPPTPDLDSVQESSEVSGMAGSHFAQSQVSQPEAIGSGLSNQEKHWSGRDSCLLALTLESSFDDEDAYAEGSVLPESTQKPAGVLGHAGPQDSLDFGFPVCSPTAPLNLAKLRQKKEGQDDDTRNPYAQPSVSGSDSSFSSMSQRSAGFESDSMPSLTSASSVSSSPASVRTPNASPFQQRMPSSISPASKARNLAIDAMPQSLASSTSLASIATTGTSILDLDLGMSHEEARRYVHRAQLSHDAFGDDLDAGLGLGLGISKEEMGMGMGMGMPAYGAPARVHEDTTPKMSSAPFPLAHGPSPAIHVVGPGGDASRFYDAGIEKDSPRLNLDLDFGGSLGLSIGPDSRSPSPAPSLSSALGPRRSSRVRSPRPSPTIRPGTAGSAYAGSDRSITPTPANTQQHLETPYHATGLGLDLGAPEHYAQQHHPANIRQSVASVASWEMGVAL